MFFKLLSKIFKIEFFDRCVKFYEKRQNQPEFCLLIILYVVAIFTLVKIFYVKPQVVVNNDIDGILLEEDNFNNAYDSIITESDDLNNNSPENNLNLHYEKVNDYLNSPDFNRDSIYWR